MKRRIAWLLVVLATLAAAVTREGKFPRFLLAFEILFFLTMFVWVRRMSKRLTADLILSEDSIYRGGRMTVKVSVRNPSWFPVSDAAVKVSLEGMSGKQTETSVKIVEGHVGADRKSTDCWQAEVQPVHCGLLGVALEEVRIYDYLGVFSSKLKINGRKKLVSVLPQIHSLKLEEELLVGGSTGETGEEVAAKAGSDTQEIFDTRFYQRGDTLRSIHWKLSAKEDDLLVKEFSMPRDLSVLVTADASMNGGKAADKEVTADLLDEFLELCVSVSACLLDHEIPHGFLWYPGGMGEPQLCRVDSEEALYAMMEELLGLQPYEENTALDDYLFSFGDELKYDPLRITLDGAVYAGERQVHYETP
ncbi:MAG: DUF58 domain-containing protein [Eubacteriales bacterium]|nr:DUF58 domain-containing protein [Eubacteriales bacterium]